jgi:hypothetical protein
MVALDRALVVLIFDQKLQERSRPKKYRSWLGSKTRNKGAIGAPGCGIKALDSPGRQGESLVKVLRRELYEETGLRAQIGSLLGVVAGVIRSTMLLGKAPWSLNHLLSAGSRSSANASNIFFKTSPLL